MNFLSLSFRRRLQAAALLGGLVWWPLAGRALDPAKSVGQFNVQNWTRQNGLPADKISAVTQTRDGYLWLGTQNGLVRFDGLDFKVVPIELAQAQGQDVAQLSAARDGGLWFAINLGGFGHYDGRRFQPVGDERWARPGINALTVVEAGDGSVWTGTQVGLGRWAKGRVADSFFDEPMGSVLALSGEPSGRVWIGTAEHGVFYREAGAAGQIADDALKALNIYAVTRDHGGELWVGTNRGLRHYDAAGTLKDVPIGDVQINALLVDRAGVLWIATGGRGLARIAEGTQTFLRKADGLGSDQLTALFADREGSLWIGTLDGLSQLTDLKFPIYSGESGIVPGGTHAVASSHAGGIWIATVAGASYFDGKTARNFGDPALVPNPYVRRLFEAKNGDVYVGDGSHNLNVLANGKLVARYTTENWPEAFAEDDESVLVGIGPSLNRIKDGRIEPYRFNPGQQDSFNWINTLAVAKDGAIWAATNSGMFRIKDGDVRRWSTAEGLSSDRVHFVLEDVDGSIWAGLPSGLVRIKHDGVVNITENDGLHDARIYAIVPDDHGYFWFSSGRGIFRVARQELDDFAEGKLKQVHAEAFDGLEAVKFTDRTDQGYSGCKSLDGRIWFPNPHGVVMIDPANFHTNTVPPPVRIQDIRVNGVELADRSSAVLHVGDRRVEFGFAALSYVAPKKMAVRYRLEGADQNWVDAGGRRSALYSNLAPGRYTFRVQAANADGVWNRDGDTFAFTLPPPFYQTGWFYSLCGLAAGAGLFGSYRWKVRHMEVRQKKLEAEKDRLEAKVRERTEELAYERDLLRTLLDNSPDHIFFKDTQSRFIKASQAQAQSFNRAAPDDLVGRTDFDFYDRAHAEQAFADEQEIVRTGRPLIGKIEQELWRDGRKPTWRITSKLPLRNKANEIVGTFGISKDITAIKESQAQLDEAHKQLLEISRAAGMAEVATGVLHNVGNVLNSVNVSATLVSDHLRHTKAVNVAKLAALFAQHRANLGEFVTSDPRGQMIPDYLATLAEALDAEQKTVAGELEQLRKNVEHIKEIVAMQQAYARTSGLIETVGLVELVEDALRINAGSLARHDIDVVRQYQARPVITTDKHKVIQILINLIRNAKYACDESGRPDKRVTLRTTRDERSVRIEVIDNGVGIKPEHFTRIFNHGFTTRAHGHGFGLHSGSLAAKELGGALLVHSDGPGQGAIFTLELPFKTELNGHEPGSS